MSGGLIDFIAQSTGDRRPMSEADFMARVSTAGEYDIQRRGRDYQRQRYRWHLWRWAEYAYDRGVDTPHE